jgi:hypothetical protein
MTVLMHNRLIRVLIMAVLSVAVVFGVSQANASADIVKGEACVYIDSYFNGRWDCMYVGTFDAEVVYNFAGADADFDDEISSVTQGGLYSYSSCLVRLYRDHNQTSTHLGLGYNTGYNDPSFVEPTSGNTEYHNALRRDLSGAYFGNGEVANDKISLLTMTCQHL